jgi:hypothetical protein
MGWIQTKIGGKSYLQDTTKGCPFACIATVQYWIDSQEKSEDYLREFLTGDSPLWKQKPDAMTGGLKLGTTMALLQAIALISESIEGLSQDAFLNRMRF